MADRNYDRLAAAAEQNIKEKEYWLKRLSGDLEKCHFPYDQETKTETEADATQRQTYSFDLSSHQSTILNKLSKGSDIKLHMILSTAVLILLNKYTEKTDIITGAPIYKQDVEMEFINTVLILRNTISESTTFKELLIQMRQSLVEATEHQNYPIEILWEQLGYTNIGTQNPLLSVMVMHQQIHEKKYLDNINYDILFSFNQTDGQVSGNVEYKTRLYEESTIKQIVNRNQGILQHLLTHPDSPIEEIELLTEEEKNRLLNDINRTEKDCELKTLHDYFIRQAQKTPDSTALVSEELLRDMQITYRELDRKSNQLASVLQQKGTGPDTIIGLMVEKSIEMMMGILGILKSGAAYLPVELAYPQSRSQYILKDSGTKILLTYALETLPEWVKKTPNLEVVDIFTPAFYKGPEPQLENINTIADAAYIIYTSGSTGRPKGVLVQHGNVSNYIEAFLDEFSMNSKDTALQQASYSFDAFVEEVYPTLSRGGKIALCPRYVIMDTPALAKFITKHNITYISVSPLLLNEINKQPGKNRIRIFISGGDLLKKEYISNIVQSGQNMVYNTYGPTEGTVCATYHRCTPEDKSNPPIGKPISNYKVYILDDNNHIKPIGIPGELCIAGPGVTRGYINNPQLTAQKFSHLQPKNAKAKKSTLTQADIFKISSKSHSTTQPLTYSTLYRTGDLARWQPEGTIEFLGRKDNQVNIRGYRVELGEIETLLLKHNAISAAVVKIKEIKNIPGTGAENLHVCAYIVNSEELTLPELKQYLSAYLPEYMIPSYFVLLERMPLTPSGKPDYKALESYQPLSATGTEYIAPATDKEKIIAQIWKEVLQLDKIGIHDNFFDLGGNSMLLLKATNKLRDAFAYKGEIPFMVMFQYTTIYTLSEYLQQLENEGKKNNQTLVRQEETLNRGKNRMKKLIRNKSNPS